MKKIGLQMYSMRKFTEKDLIAALKDVASIGVKGIEFAGYFGHSAKELKAKLAEFGLQPAGSHIGWDNFKDNLDATIAYSAELGEPYMICPSIPAEMCNSASAWLKTAELFSAVGEKVAAAGMKFCYHNHSFEFEEFEGKYGLDILFDNVDPRYVRMELDTCWCDVTGKLKAAEYMRKRAAHLELLHIKEITAIGNPAAKIIGQGAMDFKTICAVGKELGVAWYTIEHEGEEGDTLDIIAQGVKHLEGIL